VSLSVARQQLDASWLAYEAGDERKAGDLAISAYLDGFEPVEARLEALQSELRTTIEADFLHYRELLRSGEPKTTVAAQRDRLMAHLADAERALAGGELAPAAAFVASLTILAREGFEAILIVLAISALLVRAGRSIVGIHGKGRDEDVDRDGIGQELRRVAHDAGHVTAGVDRHIPSPAAERVQPAVAIARSAATDGSTAVSQRPAAPPPTRHGRGSAGSRSRSATNAASSTRSVIE